jgi:hypothetical protein
LEKDPRRLRARSLPLRYSSPKARCSFFFRTGHCLFGSLCRYSHERPRYYLRPPPQVSPFPLFTEERPALKDPLPEAHSKLARYHQDIRKDWWEQWRKEVRVGMLENERMEAPPQGPLASAFAQRIAELAES